MFALHPVQVESVAWMTELKNTLSGLCYLAAALAYFRFDESRDRRWYAVAWLAFLLALGSKTVTATLPAALAVVIWWRRGKLEWRRDIAAARADVRRPASPPASSRPGWKWPGSARTATLSG